MADTGRPGVAGVDELDDDADLAGQSGDGADDGLPWLIRDGRNLAWALLVFGGVGLLASFFLTIEYLHRLREPTAALVCDINVFMTCGPAMSSWAGSILGFPNIIIGLVAFGVTVTIAMGLFARARFARWFWVGFQVGLIGGAVLITFLQWYSGYELARLCLWCMIIWAATIPLVALTTIFNLAQGNLGPGAVRAGRALAPWAVTVVIIWYLAVAGFVVAGMWNVIALSLI
ncbi:membrane protein [Pseudoclavibacter endophyticus]|uniref:vitamin K epoxide reductase family protein n=1 Tax=Pseudoclavibacter endophyticus TaxID=1778590 RepID=UPI001668A574|nr:vitamin K epoxide reductase family protein [Pseudoclavibacter endophyticus]GGA64554.1 membrane protein [Pseudoclavibacter endophyticus]